MNYYIDPKTLHEQGEANIGSCLAIEQLIKDCNLDMSVEEFAEIYSSHRGIVNSEVNVWRNIYKWQLYTKGNRKHLMNVLGDELNFLSERPHQRFNQAEYIADFNKKNYKHYHIKVNLKDKAIIEHLEKQSNKNGYIINLIKNDIKRQSK